MYCGDCGALIDRDSKFCTQCGQRIHEESTPQRPPRSALRSVRTRSREKLQTILVFSIPVALLFLVGLWIVTAIFRGQPEDFERFLPDNTLAYVEIHDPIGRIVDFEKSSFFKKLSATQTWKDLEKSYENLRNYKDGLARVSALRKGVGPAGFAFIPSFSDEVPLFFVRVEKGYTGAVETGLEAFLKSQGVQFRRSNRDGKVRYETPQGYSILIMDSGVVAGNASTVLDKYIEWLDKKDKASLFTSTANGRTNRLSRAGNRFARVYFDSNSLGYVHGLGPGIKNFPRWVFKTDLELSSNGIILKSSSFLDKESPFAKKFLQAFQKPISNQSLKYLPRDVVAFGATNLAGVVEVIKEYFLRDGREAKEKELEEKS